MSSKFPWTTGPSISTPCTRPKEAGSSVHPHPPAALFTIAKMGKPPKHESVNKMGYFHSTKYDSAPKRKEILTHAKKWMTLKVIMPSDKSSYKRTHSAGFHLHEAHRVVKFIEPKSRMGVGNGAWRVERVQSSSSVIGRVLEMGGGNGCTAAGVSLLSLKRTLECG